MTMFARLVTPIFPVMDDLTCDIFFFFVPNRLVWDNWQKFCGEQDSPGDSTDFTIPQSDSAAGGADLDLRDYMGIPTARTNSSVNALPLRGYNLIWNTWFRDENLQNPVTVNKDNGPDTWTDTRYMLQRGKRHDYFTSCLPWPSKSPGVEIPLGDTAPVRSASGVGDTGIPTFDIGGQTALTVGSAGSVVKVDWSVQPASDATAQWNDPQLEVDLASATAATINSLRQAFQLQKLFERDARGGTRYVELVKSHFGVTSPDARLQRPEYLGGGNGQVQITSVPQATQRTTQAGWEQTYKGTLSGYGTMAQGGIGFNKSFVEHGYVFGLACIRAPLTYQQGLHKMWSRSTRYDFYWPALANIGEQAVLNKEIFFQNHDAGGAPPNDDNNKIWGYQERWAEYRYSPSRISGQFRSDAVTTLDPWHLAQDFATLPTLGDTFIKDTPPVDRITAVPTEPHFLFDSFFSIKCARPMPVYSVPGLIDHF